MTTVAERVQKLIALASSPEEAEARTSAWLACKLIREHGLHVVAVEPWVTAERKARPAPKPAPAPAAAPANSDTVRISARFDSYCKICRKLVKKGAWVYWTKGSGVVHEECAK